MLILTAAFAGLAYLSLAGVLAFVLLERKHERRDFARERSELLNRIKPETAQYIPREHHEQFANLGHVALDDDNGYWDETMTPEELAERNFKQELEEAQLAASGADT